MKELSIFVDESGNISYPDSDSRFYIIGMVFHDQSVDISSDVAKESLIGSGIMSTPGMASKMFEALFDAGINIQMISTSEIKISVLIDIADNDHAVTAIHDKFIG